MNNYQKQKAKRLKAAETIARGPVSHMVGCNTIARGPVSHMDDAPLS